MKMKRFIILICFSFLILICLSAFFFAIGNWTVSLMDFMWMRLSGSVDVGCMATEGVDAHNVHLSLILRFELRHAQATDLYLSCHALGQDIRLFCFQPPGFKRNSTSFRDRRIIFFSPFIIWLAVCFFDHDRGQSFAVDMELSPGRF